jgi:hypothetical protein
MGEAGGSMSDEKPETGQDAEVCTLVGSGRHILHTPECPASSLTQMISRYKRYVEHEVGLLKARIKYEQERVKYEQGRIAELEARLGDVTADRADIYDRAQETTGQLRYEIAKLEARLNHPHDQQVADLISSLARDGRKGKVPDSGNLEYAEQMAALLRDRANPSTDSEEHNAE